MNSIFFYIEFRYFIGSVIEKGVMCLPYGGQQVTEYLGKLLTESGYR